MEKDLLPISITRNLNDKLYEKRKLGALEIEALVKERSIFTWAAISEIESIWA